MNTKPATLPLSPPPVLDPRLLGRPVHLLPVFTERLRDDLAEFFRTGMNRRYRAEFQVGEVTMQRNDGAARGERWIRYEAAAGCIGFAPERSVLLAALHYRYGVRGTAAPAAATDAVVRETATEERLAARLGQQLVGTLAARIEAPQGTSVEGQEFSAGTACPPPAAAAWTIAVAIREAALGVQGTLWFTLDDAWMARLLHHLAAPRDKPMEPPGSNTKPLAARLQLTLVGRLLDKEMPLGELLDIRIGDVIPVSLGATEVRVDEALLFRAVVAEHAGKLCLTSFEDVE